MLTSFKKAITLLSQMKLKIEIFQIFFLQKNLISIKNMIKNHFIFQITSLKDSCLSAFPYLDQLELKNQKCSDSNGIICPLSAIFTKNCFISAIMLLSSQHFNPKRIYALI